MTVKDKFGQVGTEGLKAAATGIYNYTSSKKNHFFKMKDGMQMFRLLPPLPEKPVCQEVGVHFGVYIDGKSSAVQCSKRKHGKCPICDDADALFKLNTEESKKQAYKVRVVPQYLFNAMDAEGQVGILVMDKKCYEQLVQAQESRKMFKKADLWDAEKGELIVIAREKEKNTKKSNPANVYTITASGDSSPITADTADDIVAAMADFETVYADKTPEELEVIYYGKQVSTAETKTEAPVATPPTEETTKSVDDATVSNARALVGTISA